MLKEYLTDRGTRSEKIWDHWSTMASGLVRIYFQHIMVPTIDTK